MDYVLEHCDPVLGTEVRDHRFTDLLYAYGAALFASPPPPWLAYSAWRISVGCLSSGIKAFPDKDQVIKPGIWPCWSPSHGWHWGRWTQFPPFGTLVVISMCPATTLRRTGVASSIMGQICNGLETAQTLHSDQASNLSVLCSGCFPVWVSRLGCPQGRLMSSWGIPYAVPTTYSGHSLVQIRQKRKGVGHNSTGVHESVDHVSLSFPLWAREETTWAHPNPPSSEVCSPRRWGPSSQPILEAPSRPSPTLLA